MLQIHPSVDLAVSCPECGAALKCIDLHFAGMPIFAECACAQCGNDFVLDLPAGHALLHPVMIGRRSGKVYYDGLLWYPKLLSQIVATQAAPRTPEIRVRKLPPSSRAMVLVNCLDTVWGHSLLKFLSSLRYLKERPDLDLVAIVPRPLAWIVPADACSVIEVDMSSADFACWIAGLDRVVKTVLSEYETVYLAEAVSQPDLSRIDFSILGPEFTPKPFWHGGGGTCRQVTIVTREDRLWFHWERLQLALRRRRYLARSKVWKALVRLQNRKIGQVARRLKHLMPDLRIVAIGIGRTGAFPGFVDDLRSDSMSPERERQWCAEYARSDVVVGVHGSNMLLPSLLAGAVVELLPKSKIRNITQDIVVGRDPEPKLCLFRYRILDTAARPDYVSSTVASILNDSDRHFLNIIGNQASLKKGGWPRPINWKRLGQSAPKIGPDPPSSIPGGGAGAQDAGWDASVP